MVYSYKVEHVHRHSEGMSHHQVDLFQVRLTEMGMAGWRLKELVEFKAGWLLIFEREN